MGPDRIAVADSTCALLARRGLDALQNVIPHLKTAFQAQTRAYLKRLVPKLLIPRVRRGACLSAMRYIRAIELQTREKTQPRS